jgi:hypothetical protein
LQKLRGGSTISLQEDGRPVAMASHATFGLVLAGSGIGVNHQRTEAAAASTCSFD